MAPTWLLVTDVDDTLLGDDGAFDRLADRLVGADLSIVLNSSRPVDSVVSGATAWIDRLPVAGVIGALGTEITLDGVRLRTWEQSFVDFPRPRIAAVLDPLGTPHRDEYQTAAKISYDIDPQLWDEARAGVAAVDPGLRMITSGAASFDVIPANAGKAAATRYAAAVLGVPTERLITAGDSENDADLVATGRGVVVGNATEGLLRLVPPSVHTAEMFHAGGIVEGLEHYGALSRAQSSPNPEDPPP